MSQFSDTYTDPYDPPNAQRPRSKIAITALVLSLIGIVPCCGWVTAPIGALLGLIGMFLIGANSPQRGRGMAAAALIFGVVFSAGWIGAIYWSYDTFERPRAVGPKEALQAGFNRDIAGFRSHFYSSATDAEAQAFIEELHRRYGEFRTSHRDDAASFQANPPTFEQMIQPKHTYEYVLDFANQPVPATIESSTSDPQTGAVFVGIKFGSIVIHDPSMPILAYPPSAAVPPMTQPTMTAPDSSLSEDGA